MPFAVEAVSGNSANAVENGPTVTGFTVTNANLMLVALSWGNGTTVDAAGATVSWNGAALTAVGSSAATDSNWCSVKWFRKDNPAAGTGNVTCNTGSQAPQAAMHVITFTDASLTLGTPTTGTDTTSNPSINVTSVSGDIVVAVMATDAQASAANAGGASTIYGIQDLGNDTDHFSQYKTASGTSTTMSWTAGAAGWAASGLAVGPVASGNSVPNSDVQTTNWSSTGANFFGVIDEASFDDADYVTSPTITGVGQALICGLSNGPLSAGSYSPVVRASVSTGTATLRIKLLNDSNASQGQVDIAVDTTLKRYDPTITITGAATRISFEFFS